jgi:hypothetical protein
MWDDVIIGEGAKACTTISSYACKETNISISENSLFFRISGLIFGMGMTIYKEHKVGQKLVRMLKDRTTNFSNPQSYPEKASVADIDIEEFLNAQLLKHISPIRVIGAVQALREDAFERGKVAKAQEIRNALYINERY